MTFDLSWAAVAPLDTSLRAGFVTPSRRLAAKLPLRRTQGRELWTLAACADGGPPPPLASVSPPAGQSAPSKYLAFAPLPSGTEDMPGYVSAQVELEMK